MSEKDLVEEMAALEHKQWRHWSEHVAENNDVPDELVEKWEENWVPYEELDEETKEYDRRWAEKALSIVLVNKYE